MRGYTLRDVELWVRDMIKRELPRADALKMLNHIEYLKTITDESCKEIGESKGRVIGLPYNPVTADVIRRIFQAEAESKLSPYYNATGIVKSWINAGQVYVASIDEKDVVAVWKMTPELVMMDTVKEVFGTPNYETRWD